jgi:hypothetical protein
MIRKCNKEFGENEFVFNITNIDAYYYHSEYKILEHRDDMINFGLK